MAWTTPNTVVAGNLWTSSMYNTYVRDNTSFLFGDTAWTNASMTNSWVAGSNPPQYKISGNIVELRGLASGGALSFSLGAFTLPAGPPTYRPGHTMTIPVAANNAFGAVFITTGGAVCPCAGSTTSFGFDGVTFSTL